jgi:hypothetical protein
MKPVDENREWGRFTKGNREGGGSQRVMGKGGMGYKGDRDWREPVL